MNNIAIIPARGGSKRIPRKNIKFFLGEPIITYSIQAALKSNLFNVVMVSTDDPEIARVAKECGAEVPFFRSKKNSNDFATLADTVKEVVNIYHEKKIQFDNICCILPTAPFLNPISIIKSFEKFNTYDYDSMFPVLEFSYPIQRSLKFEKNYIEMTFKEHLNTRSQDLDKRYHDAGQYYWVKTKAFLKDQKFFLKSGAIVISELEAQDIDTETDWQLAEIKYKMIHNDKQDNF